MASQAKDPGVSADSGSRLPEQSPGVRAQTKLSPQVMKVCDHEGPAITGVRDAKVKRCRKAHGGAGQTERGLESSGAD